MCRDAGMRGELELIADPLAEAGGRLNVRVAESPQAPLRAYAESDLSGGWRARTAVLVLLAAMCAAGGQNTLPIVALDEHAAAMDEAAIEDIGTVMQGISRTRGLQIVVTMPTKRTNEATHWCDLQVGFLKAAPDQAYAPLPHLLEAAEDAAHPSV
jgi:energy-coupling factor transporter ATP-binding protein EcfA2